KNNQTLVSWNTTAADGDGDYDIRLTVTDKATNSATTTISTLTVDNTAPTVVVSCYSDAGMTVPLNVYNSKLITTARPVYLRITPNETLGSNPTVNITAPGAENNSTGTTAPSGSDYIYTWNVVNGTPGDATIVVSSADVMGNTGTSNTIVTLDFTITTPVLSANTGYDKVTLNWTKPDSDYTAYYVYRGTSGTFTADVTSLVYSTNNPLVTSWINNISPGDYYYRVKAIDMAGNFSTASDPATFGRSMIGAPTFDVEYYTSYNAGVFSGPLQTYTGKPITKDQTVYLKITASKAMDATGPIFEIDAPVSLNDATDSSTTWVSGLVYKGTWTVSSGPGSDGDAAVKVKGTSLDGGSASYGAPNSGETVTVDTTIGSFLSFTASALGLNANLNWTFPDSDTMEFKIYRSSTPGFSPNDSTNLLTVVGGGVSSYTDNPGAAATYYYKVKAVDYAKNEAASGQASATTVADATPPVFLKAEATSKQVIYLTFDEAIKDPNTAGSIISINGGMTIVQIVLTGDNRIVQLVLGSDQGRGNQYSTPLTYTITVEHIYDLANNELVGPVSQSFDAFTPHGKYSPYPVAANGSTRLCGQCHLTHGAVRKDLLNGVTVKKVCFVCHGVVGTSIYQVEKEFYNWDNANVAAGVYSTSLHRSLDNSSPGYDVLTCTDCHDPHGTRRPGTNDIYPKLLAAKNVYGAVYTAAQGNWFCLACHGFGDVSTSVYYSNPGRFSGYWSSTGGLHDSGMTVSGGSYNAVHYDTGIKSGLMLPVSGTNITCTKCHDRHGSTVSSLVYHGYSNAREQLCYDCHDTTANSINSVNIQAKFGLTSKHNITDPVNIGLTCSSCHGPHSVAARTYDNSSSTLPSDISDPANTKNNWNKSSSSMGITGYCIKCHDVASGQTLAKTINDTTIVPYSVYFPNITLIYSSGWDKSSYTASRHSVQLIECDKCHDPHGSNNSRLETVAEGTNTTDMCVRCHGGADTPAGPNVYTNGFGAAYKHPTLTTSGVHTDTESTNANWNQGAARHAECQDCHDPHNAQAGTTRDANDDGTQDWTNFGANGVPDNETRLDDILPGSLKGQWGVTIGLGTFTPGTTPGNNIYTYTSTPNRQYEVCLKCHSSYAYDGSGSSTTYDGTPSGTPPTTTYPLTTYISAGSMGAAKQPDIAEQFNPGNYAFHPLFRIGLNQPPTNANANWASSNGRRDATSTYRGGDGVTATYNNNITPAGLDHTFVDGWGTKSLVLCSDCHASSDTTVGGPHGSSQKFLMRKIEPRTVKIYNGGTPVTVTLNTGTQLTPAYAGDTRAQNNFCLNCHRADVYGNGQGDIILNTGVAAWVNLSRLSHNFRTATTPTGNCMASGNKVLGTVDQSPSCLGCHGGREVGGIHGTRLVSSGNPGVDSQGKRFANGANWGGHNFNPIGCYTVSNDNVANCGHGHSGANTGVNYTY
ncbi:MAG: cytochrome c3 family protein, partial [Eubacteriales bacterium]